MSTASSWDWPAGARWQQRFLAAGIVGAGLCVLGAIVDREQFFRSYLLGYLSWLGITLGSLALWMIHLLTGGDWGVVIRRILEAASRNLLAMTLLFLPIAFGLAWIYPWAHAHEAEHAAKAQYLNVPFFLVRAGLYFAIWLGLVFWLGRCSTLQDQSADPEVEFRAQRISGPGLVVYGLTYTFAAIDWIMSLEPEWYSSIFGVLVATGQMLPALALAIVVASWLAPEPTLAEVAPPPVWNDLGNLLLAFVMLWTYMAFSQYYLIWSGNLPEEITWYLHRTEGGWQWLAVALGILYFAVPFLLLLPRECKRAPDRLRRVALLVLAMHFVNHYWMIVPSFAPGQLFLHWMDGAAWLGIGGVWSALFVRQLQSRPLVALHRAVVSEEAPHHA